MTKTFWETIDFGDFDPIELLTLRAKVADGWLVLVCGQHDQLPERLRAVNRIRFTEDGVLANNGLDHWGAVTFISDPAHSWEVTASE